MIRGRMVRREELTAESRQAMYALMARYFEGVCRDAFEADLEAKSHAILLEDAGTLCGFTTLGMRTMDGFTVVFSGDTIVDRRAWGSSALARTWIESVQRLRREYPMGPLYWLLICCGYRTYHFLPLFFRTFYPRHDAPTPPQTEALMRRLARLWFGSQFSEKDGVVRFDRSYRLSEGVGDITPERLQDPHVAFFAARNPGHLNGDELVCLTEITEANLTPAGRRMAGLRTAVLQP